MTVLEHAPFLREVSLKEATTADGVTQFQLQVRCVPKVMVSMTILRVSPAVAEELGITEDSLAAAGRSGVLARGRSIRLTDELAFMLRYLSDGAGRKVVAAPRLLLRFDEAGELDALGGSDPPYRLWVAHVRATPRLDTRGIGLDLAMELADGRRGTFNGAASDIQILGVPSAEDADVIVMAVSVRPQ
jgi:hypothetical protein